MLAIRPNEPGGPEVLQLRELPTPAPGGGQLLVRTEAIGVNYIDVYHRTGLYKLDSPLRLGQEGAGIVESVGSGVKEVKVGDRVAWCSGPGSYATHVILDEARVVPVPAGIDPQLAGALLLQGLTAHYLAVDTFATSAEHTVLVHAAAGGVGLLLVQIARRRGARVLATVSTPEKAELARAAGAEHVILYTDQDFSTEVRKLTAGAGVHAVYDSVGKSTFEKSLRSLRPRGMMVLYGQSSGPVEKIDPQILAANGSLFLTRPTLGHYTASREELLSRAQDLLTWVQSGHLTVRIGATFPLSEARAAHEALEARKTTGKVVLLP
ncbi:MAG TPA: quinone oxidoreductase [Polyangiaceae bacterium]|nr:quinone oxidoreductase [Polyangiaceae bacterium]